MANRKQNKGVISVTLKVSCQHAIQPEVHREKYRTGTVRRGKVNKNGAIKTQLEMFVTKGKEKCAATDRSLARQKIPIALASCISETKASPKPERQCLNSAREKLTTYPCNDPKSIDTSACGQKK